MAYGEKSVSCPWFDATSWEGNHYYQFLFCERDTFNSSIMPPASLNYYPIVRAVWSGVSGKRYREHVHSFLQVNKWGYISKSKSRRREDQGLWQPCDFMDFFFFFFLDFLQSCAEFYGCYNHAAVIKNNCCHLQSAYSVPGTNVPYRAYHS